MTRATTGKAFREWLPAIVIVTGVIAGYVQLSANSSANSRAIEKQAIALERISELLINDARHEVELQSLRRDLNVMWNELRDHKEKSVYED